MTEFKICSPPPIDRREILRYARCGEDNDAIDSLLNEALKESESVLNYRVCFCEPKFTIDGDKCDFGVFSVSSKSLSKNLLKAKRAIIFLASVGHGIDRLIQKYSKISPAKALMLGAIGTERVEALADAFCECMEKTYSMQALPRFSPGYGDLPLTLQGEIFALLKPEKQMAVYLNESFLMSPSKSVTAFLGLK